MKTSGVSITRPPRNSSVQATIRPGRTLRAPRSMTPDPDRVSVIAVTSAVPQDAELDQRDREQDQDQAHGLRGGVAHVEGVERRLVDQELQGFRAVERPAGI